MSWNTMSIIKKIRQILSNEKLDSADKIIEIESYLPKEKEIEISEIFEHTDNPRLKNQNDLYYDGCGCTWGTDLDGKRYWKRYSRFITDSGRSNNRYYHLSEGDIINEKARIKKLVQECLYEIGF